MSVERRPKYQRPCPMREQDGCGWVQVTEWFVGGPDSTMVVPDRFLMAEAEAHLMSAHFTAPKLIIP